MARRASTASSNASDGRAPWESGDAGAGSPPADSSSDAGPQGDGSSPPKKRKRGPNKPKAGTFVVQTIAHMRHEEIVKLLTAHANSLLGSEVASQLKLLVLVEGSLRPLDQVLSPGAVLQFGTDC